jgi:cytochrome c556
MLIATACLLAAGLAGSVVRGQDQSAATPADAIFARKTVMDTLSSKMDDIETATAGTTKIDLAAANEQADIVSVLLMAFPHLFPAASEPPSRSFAPPATAATRST